MDAGLGLSFCAKDWEMFCVRRNFGRGDVALEIEEKRIMNLKALRDKNTHDKLRIACVHVVNRRIVIWLPCVIRVQKRMKMTMMTGIFPLWRTSHQHPSYRTFLWKRALIPAIPVSGVPQWEKRTKVLLEERYIITVKQYKCCGIVKKMTKAALYLIY